MSKCKSNIMSKCKCLLMIFIDDHITSICRRTFFHIRNMGNIGNLLPFNACSIIHALISCRLDYSNSILYNVPTHKTDRLQRLQNQCARILTKSTHREHITPVLITYIGLKRPRLRARRVKVRFSLRAIILSLENLNVIIRAIN